MSKLVKSLYAYLVVGLILLGIYILYTGSISMMELILGVIVGFSVAYIFTDEWVKNPSKLNLKRLAVLVAYALKYFTVIEARAHWSVVKAILSPKPSLKPAIVRLPYRVSNEYAIVTIANSITNTPGTVVVDVSEDKKALFVHWLFAEVTKDEEARKKISAEFESWARLIFEEG